MAQCETQQNWKMRGYIRSGGLGINNSNWVAYGGTQFASNASEATPEQQVLVAIRIQRLGGASDYVPDQDGYCRSW